MKDPVSRILEDKGRVVHTVGPEATVEAAVEQMNEARIGSLVVVEKERPVGIFTERDVLVRVVAARRDAAATKVAEVMTRDPLTIRPETTVGDAMVIVTERRCRHLPVVDPRRRLAGLVSIGDLTRWMVRDQERLIEDLENYIHGVYPGQRS